MLFRSPVFLELEALFSELSRILALPPLSDFDRQYDQIVSYGELFSSVILGAWLKECGLNIKWTDARNFIKTDTSYREGNVDWLTTEPLIRKTFPDNKQAYITQGFIGSSSADTITTLGREGSDYTAAIIAFSIDAENLTIWKDVPGVLNADPKWFDQTILIEIGRAHV